jgi:ribosome-binding protein aMBF1 (putative translation factor)
MAILSDFVASAMAGAGFYPRSAEKQGDFPWKRPQANRVRRRMLRFLFARVQNYHCNFIHYRHIFAQMIAISTLRNRNPRKIAEELGRRLRRIRLSRGWTQAELAERAGVGLSSLKSLEAEGKGTLLRFLQVAAILGVVDECADLFSETRAYESLEALQLAERKRAPRRNKNGKAP